MSVRREEAPVSPPRVLRASKNMSPPKTPKTQRKNSRALSIFLVLACTLIGCLFFPLFVTLSFIIILNRKVREALIGTSDIVILLAQLAACLPFYFAGPILLTICAGVQILFSAYHSAASEFLLISFCLPFLFTSPWWGSWWYVTFVPLACIVPVCYVLWRRVSSAIKPLWQKWSYEKGMRASVVTHLNAARYHVNKILNKTGHSFPFVRYLRKFVSDQFAS